MHIVLFVTFIVSPYLHINKYHHHYKWHLAVHCSCKLSRLVVNSVMTSAICIYVDRIFNQFHLVIGMSFTLLITHIKQMAALVLQIEI